MIAFFLKHKNQFWLYVALLVAFALRVYKLDAQSLWNDEGTSVALASLSIDAIINGAARDIHPPLYYLLLRNWLLVSGNSEFAVRFFSVIAGTLTVAFIFRIAYVFFDEEVAIIAACLATFSPFAIYYSQETRMYIWVTLFATISTFAMTMMFKRQSSSTIANSRTRRSLFWLLYIAATIAMLYTQYVGAFVIIAQNLAFVVWLVLALRDQRAKVWHSVVFWGGAQLISGLVFLPWYLIAGGQLASWPSISEPFDLPTLIWHVLNVFSVGLTLDANAAAGIAIAFAILFFIGWRRTRDANADWVIATLAAWTLTPIAAMHIVSLSRPAYNPKFLLLATPAFYILAARGLSLIYPGVFLHRRHAPIRTPMRWIAFVIAALAAAGPLTSVQNYYADPRYARDDYRVVVRSIDANARAGDAILIDAPGQIDVVRYYHRGDQQLYLLPRMRPPDPIATRDDVDALIAQSQRVFAIFYATDQSDPQNIIGTRLAERTFQARDEWRGDIRLAIYGIAPNARANAQTLNVKLGDAITLINYQLDQRASRAGDVLTLTLNWRADQTPSSRYKVFAQLINAENQVVAQRDAEPMNNLKLTTQWRVGEIIVDNLGIWIEPGTPSGDYRVIVGMYRADNGARLQIGASDHLVIAAVQIVE